MTMIRNPWYEIARANRDLAERMAENGGNRTYRLALNAYETDNEIVISAAVPGLDPDNIHINLEDDVLTIEGSFGSLPFPDHFVLHFQENPPQAGAG